ncbi:hypothetical protein HJG54_33615 [Leptolyngbya sp. NK1-12]|uniref:Uncharacterized protein n=1 Tax=Leptolyngbya sp. NK1-12 TaxID=2547451 RepID=A0AA96WMG6_9CYAN|nr:hypothetical protein [Leptolyngbya sp. NK1-12]WNZ27775.1 hypothetical protein HJG54_33615 [Leptolyngbya sp. NK1-12]
MTCLTEKSFAHSGSRRGAASRSVTAAIQTKSATRLSFVERPEPTSLVDE